MKTNFARRQNERGLAVILIMALLAIVLIYVAGNLGALHHLGRDLHLIERKQIRRLQSLSITNVASLTSTNAIAASESAHRGAVQFPAMPQPNPL